MKGGEILTATAALEAATLCEAFQATAELHPTDVALRTQGDSFTLTWSEYRTRVKALAEGLAGLGLQRHQALAIQLTSRPEFHLFDMAGLHLGSTGFSIYNTSSAAQIAERLNQADARIMITEQAFLGQVREAVASYGRLDHLIVIDGTDLADGELSLVDVEAARPETFDFEATWQAVAPEDIATLIFTSGTTGPPKAVQLSHYNVMTVLRSIDQVVPLPHENVVSFMPMAHIAERMWSHYMPLIYGATSTCCPDRNQVFACVREVRPDHLWLVPRMWQKLKEFIEGQIAGMEPERRAAIEKALEVGYRRVAAEQAGESLPAPEAAAAEQALALLRETFVVPLGLDGGRGIGVGGAPSPRSLSEFFHALGVPIFEGYGLTECTGFGAIFSSPEDSRIGSVGKPLPGVECKLADDGELLLRSEMNMVGYRNDPEATAEAIDEEGWLHTGDIASIDADGFVSIVDRKKDLIINAYGKNMSPVTIEEAIKDRTNLISQVVAIGDGRPYNVALVTLEPQAAAAFAADRGLDGVADSAHPEIISTIEQAIDEANQDLARVEQIQKFTVLERDWQPDSDELTPTMKLRRRKIADKYEPDIESLYSE
jgi:long-subunit acyl-CoA synthetase (AMP-forming)